MIIVFTYLTRGLQGHPRVRLREIVEALFTNIVYRYFGNTSLRSFELESVGWNTLK